MAKYDSVRKLERNIALVEYYTSHSAISLREVGKAFSISRQRAWKIISDYEKQLGHKIVREVSDA